MRFLLLAWTAVLASAAVPSALSPSLRFERNLGQTDSRAQFVARSARGTILLTHTGPVLARRNSVEGIHIRFVNSAPARLKGADRIPGVVNYFRGRTAITNVSTYQRVRQRGIYPGIDAVYHGQGSETPSGLSRWVEWRPRHSPSAVPPAWKSPSNKTERVVQ